MVISLKLVPCRPCITLVGLDKDKRFPEFFQRIKNALIYSNLWVSIALAALTVTITVLHDRLITTSAIFSFCMAFAGYNYIYLSVYFITPNKITNQRKQWMDRHKTLLVLGCLISSLTALFVLTSSNNIHYWFFVVFLILSSFYIVPVKKNLGLRFIPTAKIFVISSAWVLLIMSSLPHIDRDQWLIIALFSYLLAITIPFDIRDINTDPARLKTIPQIIGVKNSIYLAQCLNIIALLILSIRFYQPSILIANLIYGVLATTAFNKLRHQSSKTYINFHIEGLPILWCLLILVVSLF